MSYHKDGSLLNKNKDFKKPIYTNPLGEGIRCTPTIVLIPYSRYFS